MDRLLEIDQFFASEKTLVGDPIWKVPPDKGRADIVAPLSINGVVQGRFELRASVPIYAPIQSGVVLLLFERSCVQRLKFRSKGRHVNPGGSHVPRKLRFKSFHQGGDWVYRWENDRVWPPAFPKGVNVAELMPSAASDFEEAVSYFFLISNIVGTPATAPHEPRFF